jgi:hypothetical protein
MCSGVKHSNISIDDQSVLCVRFEHANSLVEVVLKQFVHGGKRNVFLDLGKSLGCVLDVLLLNLARPLVQDLGGIGRRICVDDADGGETLGTDVFGLLHCHVYGSNLLVGDQLLVCHLGFDNGHFIGIWKIDL